MTEKKPPEPFELLVNDRLPPRPGPTMVSILAQLDKTVELVGQVLKRQQQTALMVDGFASAVNRRFDILHEETALLRAAVNRPHNDNDATVEVDVEDESEEPEAKRPTVRSAIVLSGKVLSYGTSAAIGLRLVGKAFPEYEAAIDGVLGLVGL